ncbi:MAG: glycosyl transferase family protein [Flavisolibacter sp.]|jgi:hypothetical protein|nr:glycosyl transferase family protein [Flavisolibacter sp.]
MSPGKIIYNLYYRPLELLQTTLKTGVRRTTAINAGKKQMLVAASGLTEVTYSEGPKYNVYFLTGKKYWFQTAFCLYSLQKNAGVSIHAFLIDDGSFNDELEAQVAKQFPTTTTVIRSSHLRTLLDEQIPETDFPVLRQRRIEYPHLRKLTDVHVLPGDGPKLVLDSDMLFFHKPVDLLNWLSNPEKLLFMRDVTESYGYTNELMKELTATDKIPERLNVGVAGIPSKMINWERLEYWTDELLKREGSSYLQEQALTAMLAADEPTIFLDEVNYKVLPTISGPTVPEVLHHYVAEAKYDYFVKGWKFFVNKSR